MARNPNIPSEEAAHGAGNDSENETVSAREASGKVLAPERTGPDLGDGGNYKPALYPVTREVVTPTGATLVINARREDR